MIRGAAMVTVGLVLAVLAFVLCARAGWLTPDDAVLRARYALPHSRFAVISGEQIHYVDAGRGDPIVLIHGSLASPRVWNDWAAALKGRYYVIRYDEPPMGVSEPSPVGRYDVIPRMIRLGRTALSHSGVRGG